ncbi:DUF4040 domain-containing protein [Chitinispirillales bacterium ANBcel5]|uniref:Na(+)/H(+) antiporter subunit B n=1 Tax=Cellulosispirillum alkaliphilum TaxID=3039283 RepID=UPI002A533F06|nr:DUF4040 domain-containing protein [Chitinispirillales bacterium ANBcel5]
MSIAAILILLHVAVAAMALQSRDLIGTVVHMAVFSLLSSLLFFYLHAPDVALTEAAVGAGVSTFIYIWVIRKTVRRDDS